MGVVIGSDVGQSERFHRTARTEADIRTQVSAELFAGEPRQIEGLQTFPDIACTVVLDSIQRRAQSVLEFARLFPTHNTKVTQIELDLLIQQKYAKEGLSRLQRDQRPANWGTFIFDYVLDLWVDANHSMKAIRESFERRHSATPDDPRKQEYEVLREVTKKEGLSGIAQSADKLLQSPHARTYALAAIEMILQMQYKKQTALRRQIMENLITSGNDVVMMYAYILSSLNNTDIFTQYAKKNLAKNQVRTNWVFDNNR